MGIGENRVADKKPARGSYIIRILERDRYK